MSTQESHDLGARLVALAPPIDLPVDLIDGVRRRARRRVAARLSGASAGVAALVAGVLMLVHVFVGPAGPSGTELRALLASGDAPAVQYTGPGALKHTPMWLVAEHYSPPHHEVIVSYRQNGKPCLGNIDWTQEEKLGVSDSVDGICSLGDTIDALGSYGPLGPASMMGHLALLYGTVPADVRVVRADVNSGSHLAERFVPTVSTPTTGKERFFVFTAPNGTEHGIDVDLTFYDANGDRIGSRHVKDDFDVNGGGDTDCSKPAPGTACAQATISAAPEPSKTG